ncbi:MAG: GNAT family N-acetyltransferase, partial [Rhodospirillaceae bacterium]|nr:GNAT family N-acetyltransferase [Rhodospirillaceae bacterium]
LTSLVSALITTPRAEIAEAPGLAAALTRLGLDAAAAAATAIGADTAAIVNNTLLSVSPEDDRAMPGLAQAIAAASLRWPDRILAVRGLLVDADAAKQLARTAAGFCVPHRISYAFTPGAPAKINAVRDAGLLAKAKLERIGHDDFDTARLAEARRQYLDVYVGRHGGRNPALTADFFARLHAARAAEFIGLADDQGMAAFAAVRDHGAFLSVPLIGYRVAADRKAGYYRQMCARVLEVAGARGLPVNFGAGAARYKTLRGGAPVIEYMVIVPPRDTWLGRALRAALSRSETHLQRLVPRLIAAHGG